MTIDLTTVLVAAASSSISGIAAFIKSWLNGRKLKTIHVEMNGRFTELLNLTRQQGFEAGQKSEREKNA
jgi:hypothetical protein